MNIFIVSCLYSFLFKVNLLCTCPYKEKLDMTWVFFTLCRSKYRHLAAINISKKHTIPENGSSAYIRRFVAAHNTGNVLCLVGTQLHGVTVYWTWSGSLPPGQTTCTSASTQNWACGATCWRNACTSGRTCWDRASTIHNSSTLSFLFSYNINLSASSDLPNGFLNQNPKIYSSDCH